MKRRMSALAEDEAVFARRADRTAEPAGRGDVGELACAVRRQAQRPDEHRRELRARDARVAVKGAAAAAEEDLAARHLADDAFVPLAHRVGEARLIVNQS